jgi:hypothetical protein
VQSTGLHIAGQKYIVIKADETSLYGKKVRQTGHSACRGNLTPRGTVETHAWGSKSKSEANEFSGFLTGPRRRRDRQDETSPPDHMLPRDRTARHGSQHGRETRRLPSRSGILGYTHSRARGRWDGKHEAGPCGEVFLGQTSQTRASG